MLPKQLKYPKRLTAVCVLLFVLYASCTDRKSKYTEDTREVKSIIDHASVRYKSANYPAQLLFIDSAIQNRKLSTSDKLLIYQYKSEIYNIQLHQPEKANLYLDSIFDIIEKKGVARYKTEYASAHYGRGDILYSQQKYNEAYEYYYKARALGKTNLDSCTLSEYSFRLAMVLYRQARFHEAAGVFKRSLEESNSCSFDFDKFFRRQQVMDNIGLSYYKAGMNDSALYFYDKALEYINAHKEQFNGREKLFDIARAVVYGNMADIYNLRSETAAAKSLLKQSIDINSRKGHDNNDAQYSQVKLAEIYYNEHYIDSMFAVLQQLKTGLDTVSNTRAEMDWHRLMWRFEEGRKNIPEAYRHLDRFTELHEALEKENSRIRSSDLSDQIRKLETQFQIQALKKDNEVKNIYLWLAFIGSVAAVIIVFFIFRNLIRSKKNVELLSSLNNQIEEQKQQLQSALATVEEKNVQQNRILRMVAHDLRAPVATISMLSELIDQEKDESSRKEMVEFIRRSCNNSLELIAEILEAADLSRKEEQQKESASINALIKTTVDLLQIKASEKQQRISTKIPSEELFIMMNPEKIKRVLNNLITNAIKFSPNGEAIAVGLSADAAFVTITVKDNGIGIPDNIKDKVFEMFTEAKRKGTNGELPYGLGLSICKQIVDAHNGSIWLESKGKGTTFYVQLPI